MGFQTKQPIKGYWTAVLTGPDSDGNVVEKIRKAGFNVVTTVGKEFLASYLTSAVAGAATFTMKYVGIGTDSTAEAVGNTTLGVELTRTTGTASYLSGQIFQVVATFAAGTGTGAIVEYGLFSSSTGGTMFARDTEAVINKGASDTLTVTSQFTFS